RLMKAIGREDIALDEAYATNERRAQQTEFLDGTILDWTKSQSLEEAHQILDEYDVPNSPTYRVEDMMHDPPCADGNMSESIEVSGVGALSMPGIKPKISETPGEIKWPGPELGAPNEEVYKELLGMSDEELARLKEEDII